MYQEKVSKLLSRLEEVEHLLGQPHLLDDKKKYKELTQEHAYLTELKQNWLSFLDCNKRMVENENMLKIEVDSFLIEMIKEDLVSLQDQLAVSQKNVERLLIPPDPFDNRNVIIELRAGTGGDEAAIFVGDCIRMYHYYAQKKGWSAEVLSFTESEMGGFKDYVMILSGHQVHRFLQYEAGTHRVQRVPKTESQGRIHTSAITIAILVEPDEDEKVVIDEKDLKIDTYRASGAGGQHVNVTDSAVRITHLPSGVVVTCQDERSQHKNKDKAMRLLMAKLSQDKREKQQKEIAAIRSNQVGSGDRSERIRTYNFPQNRLTDHRIDLTLFKLDKVMEGDLDEITHPLVAYFYQKKFETV
ncbi:MAG: peptide chain release factor 1 [Rhabdochlamydiaceae bacterium]